MNNTLLLMEKMMVNEKYFDWELIEWAVICRDLYQYRWMGGGGGGGGGGVQMPTLTD